MRNKYLSLIACAAILALAPSLLAAEAGAWTEEGLASWYGAEFQGRPTSSGEIFNPANMTAAHKSLPFGTMVRVSSPTTGREVVVRINDRGPFVVGRIIDLSQAAAQKLGIGAAGTVLVRLSLDGSGATSTGVPASPQISAPAQLAAVAGAAPAAAPQPVADNPWRTVQIGSFSSQANAKGLIDSLALQGVAASIESISNQSIYRVVIANVPLAGIDPLVEKLRGLGYAKVLVRK
jgi:rare lipoprotein A